MRLQETAEGVVLHVRVKPSSKEFRVTVEDDKLVVFCREAPVKGKVNKELLKQLSRLLGGKVELVSGFTRRQKRFLVFGVDADEINRVLVSIT
jgi:hypothetical protein